MSLKCPICEFSLGKHVVSLFTQYTPFKPSDGSWEDPAYRVIHNLFIIEILCIPNTIGIHVNSSIIFAVSAWHDVAIYISTWIIFLNLSLNLLAVWIINLLASLPSHNIYHIISEFQCWQMAGFSGIVYAQMFWYDWWICPWLQLIHHWLRHVDTPRSWKRIWTDRYESELKFNE